jgi:hypothetical protein
MQHIGEVIGSIFDRGTLPCSVRTLEALGPIEPGSVLAWSDVDRAYMHPTGRWVVWALTVRQGWGRVFEAYATPAAPSSTITRQSDTKAA